MEQNTNQQSPGTALAPVNNIPKKEEQKPAMNVGGQGLQLKTLDDMWRLASYIIKGKMAPKGYTAPEQVLIAIQMGIEVGLKPMQSLKAIAVINGTPSLWGDGLLAVIQQHPAYEYHKEWYENKDKLGTKDEEMVAAHCIFKRKGSPEHHVVYDVPRAKRAKLWGKDGPWKNDSLRQMQMRARAFCGRDQFADAIMGLSIAEEVLDYPPEAFNSQNQPAPTGPKFDNEAISASNGTAKAPEQPSEPIKAEEAEFKDVPEKTDTPETKPEEETKSDAPADSGTLFKSKEEIDAEFNEAHPR